MGVGLHGGGGGLTVAVGRKQVVCLIADTHPELLT